MQKELKADYPNLAIQLIGVNKVGKEAGNETATEGRDIPFLQDVDANGDGASDAWSGWNVEWRDVVILDANNMKVGTYNLTKHNLEYPDNYATLRQMLIDAASEAPLSRDAPWQNPVNPLDINNDTLVTPVGDVLPGINELNNRLICDEVGRLPVPLEPSITPPPYFDVNGDNYISPVGDILPVINVLNNETAGEGEKAADNDLARIGTRVNVLAPADTQTEDAVVGTGRRTPADLPASYLSSWSGNGLDVRLRATNETGVDSRIHDRPAYREPVAMETGDRLGTLEPLLVDLAEDLARVWYEPH